jgi:hypothetical protein
MKAYSQVLREQILQIIDQGKPQTPSLQAEQIVCMDNLHTHKGEQ